MAVNMDIPNSIWATYLHAKQLRLHEEQAKQQHELALEHLKETSKQHADNLKIQQQTHKLHESLAAEQMKNAYYEHVASGIEKPPMEAQTPDLSAIVSQPQTVNESPISFQPITRGTPFQWPNPITGEKQTINPVLPDEVANQSAKNLRTLGSAKAEVAGKIKGAEAEAELPTDIAKIQQHTEGQLQVQKTKAEEEKLIREQDSTNKLAQIKVQGENALRVAALTTQGRLAAANIQAAAKRYAVDNKKSGEELDPNELSAAVAAYGTGHINAETATKNNLHIIGAAKTAGIKEFKPKDRDTLIAANSLDTLMPQLESFIQYLPDGKLGQVGNLLSMKNPLPTEIRAKLDEIKTHAINYAKIIEGATGGRITMQQVNLALDGMTGGTLTKTEALSKLKNIRNQLDTKVNKIILGPYNPSQRAMIMSDIGNASAVTTLAYPKKNSAGHTLNEEMSQKLGKAIYE